MANTPTVGSIGFRITAEDDRFVKELQRAGERGRKALEGVTDKADDVGDRLSRAGREGGSAMQKIDRQADKAAGALGRAERNANQLRNTVSGLALGAAFVAGTDIIAQFAQAMSTVKGITGATDTQFDQLREKAKLLGAQTRFSATEAAEGMIFLARAGFDVDEVLGSIEGTLQLAQAGAIGLGDAADIASNILQGFQLDVSETGRLVDILAKAANSSNTDIRQLGDAMKYVAPVATGLGVSAEETTAAVSALSDAGLQATQAGTGLRKVLLSLETPTAAGRKALARLGLTAEDVRISQIGLAEALENLKNAGLSNQDAKDIFGIIGLPAFQVLDSSVTKVRELTEAYENADGTAAKLSATMDDNLNGALLAVRSRLEALVIALGDAGAEQALRDALEGLARLLTIAAQNADVLAIAIVALTVRALLPFVQVVLGRGAAALAGLGGQLSLIAFKAGPAAAALTALKAGIIGLATALGPATIAIGLAAAAYLAMARNAAEARERIDRADASIAAMNSTLAETESLAQNSGLDALERDASLAERAVDALTDAYGALGEAIREATNDARLNALFEITAEGADALQQIEELSQERDKAIRAARARAEAARVPVTGNAIPDPLADPSTLVGPDPDVAAREAARKFDLSDEGKRLKELERTLGKLQARGEAISRDLFQPDNYDALLGQREQLASIEEEIVKARNAGLDDAAARLEEQKELIEETIRNLEGGLNLEVSLDVARETLRERKAGAPRDKTKKETEEEEAEEKRRAEEAQRERERLADQRKRLANIREELALGAALRDGDEARAAAIRQDIRARSLANELIDAGVDSELAWIRARQEAAAEAEHAEAARQKALREVIAQRDLDLAIQSAQLSGDEKTARTLEEQRDLMQRINQLRSEGLSAEEATTRAIYEQNVLRQAEPSEYERARTQFTEGLSGDISAALSNAVRTGDYGNLVQEVFGSAAQRGLEDAINNLADKLAEFFAGITFGSPDGQGGFSFGSIFGNPSGAGGGPSGVGTPGIVDSHTAEALRGLGTAAEGASMAAEGAGTVLEGQLAAGAVQAALSQTTQSSAAVTTAGQLLALGQAASFAASALATISAQQSVDSGITALSSLSFGGGRAHGGPVQPGKFYEVNEGGLPELFKVSGKTFLMPGQAGMIEPLAAMRAGERVDSGASEIFITAQGTGNEELDRLLTQAINRATAIARQQAGPAAANFRSRKL